VKTNFMHYTPLHFAKTRSIAMYLIEHKCDVNFRDPLTGYTMLHFHVSCGRDDIVIMLLNHGADVNATCVIDGREMNSLQHASHLVRIVDKELQDPALVNKEKERKELESKRIHFNLILQYIVRN